MTTSRRLDELTTEECWEQLGSTPIGRIAWVDSGGPVVIPVNIAVSDGTVRVRTAPYSALALKADDERVAIEVDGFDEATHTGWSVLARGRAELTYGADPDAPEPWADGSRPVTVVVAVDELSGRRLV